jgi:ligand-binding SRPBCC domain-containing protein
MQAENGVTLKPDRRAAVTVFEHRSRFPAPVEALRAFHENPDALALLTPPPLVVQTLRDTRTSLVEGDLVFRMWFGPLPVRWHARHEPGPTALSFVDRMVDGPMATWVHEHIFIPTGGPTGGGAELVDRVTLAHKPGWRGALTRLFFDGVPLRLLFRYRHWRIRLALRGSVDAWA